MDKLKMIIVDDHQVVRRGISILLSDLFEEVEVKEVEDFFKVIAILLKFDAHIIILDINIPGGGSTEMINRIRQVNNNILILIFSAYEESSYAWRYINAGANGFLSKNASEKEIGDAIKTLLETGKYISSNVKEKIIDNMLKNIPMDPLKVLSKREIEVAEFLTRGEGILEIANHLNVQPTTISTYKNRIFEKLKISNLVDLIDLFKIHKD